MMHINGTHVIVAPCCRRQYSTLAFSNDAYWVEESWTDGRNTGIRRPPDDDLRRCRCGELVFLSECKRLRFVPLSLAEQDAIGEAPATERGLWQALRELMPLRHLVRPVAPSGQLRVTTPDLPSLGYVYDSEVSNTILRYSGRREIEIALRRRLWRHFNDRYRKPASWLELSDMHCSVPPYEPTAIEVMNMERLLELLSAQPQAHREWLDIAELHRGLGRFDACLASLLAARRDPTLRHRAIARSAERAVREPVRCA